jgi:hypothetical protein
LHAVRVFSSKRRQLAHPVPNILMMIAFSKNQFSFTSQTSQASTSNFKLSDKAWN